MKRLYLMLLLVLLAHLAISQSHSPDYNKGMEAYDRGDFKMYKDWMSIAHTTNPEHDVITFEYLRALWLNDKSTEARSLANRLIARRSVMAHQLATAEFDGLLDQSLTEKLTKLRLPQVHSDTVNILTERDLVPEGIAIDERTGIKYVGSIYKQKIIVIQPGGAVSDFSHPQDSLWCVLGLEVDESDGALWTAQAYLPTEHKAPDDGCSKLSKFDLKTGRLLDSFRLCDDMLNDVTVHEGDVYATGTVKAIVYKYQREKASFEPWLDLGVEGYRYMNGIAIDPQSQRLYVSHETGLVMANLATGHWQPIEKPDHISLIGVDGLTFYKGGLIAHQKMLNSITYYRLNADGKSITDYQVMDANHPAFDSPTTGELGGDGYYYYLANTQIRTAYSSPGVVRHYYELKDKLIFRWKLELH